MTLLPQRKSLIAYTILVRNHHRWTGQRLKESSNTLTPSLIAVCRANRVVHDDAQKLRTLLQKRIQADFLSTTLAVLNIQLAAVPLVLTFQTALNSLRAEVQKWNNKSTGGRFARARQQRNISEVKPASRTKTRTDSTWEMLADEKIGRENEETNRDKIVGGDDHELGARGNILRVERRENITGISEDIPDKYFCPLAKNNVRKKIGKEKLHVAHKTRENQNSRFADTKMRPNDEEGDKEGSQCHKEKGVDTTDFREHCHQSEDKKNNDKQV